jgi:hypothetical protein
MAPRALEHRVQNIERRLTSVEQILPTLATKADLQAAIAPLATRAEVKADIEMAIAPLATKAQVKADIETAVAPLATTAEMKAEAAETRRHFDVMAEALHADIRMVAEGVVALQAADDARHVEVMGILAQHDRRLTRLEASPPGRP